MSKHDQLTSQLLAGVATTDDAEEQQVLLDAARVIQELERELAELQEQVAAWGQAVAWVRKQYPTDIWADTTVEDAQEALEASKAASVKPPDSFAATAARKTCENIIAVQREIAAKAAEGGAG